MECVYVVRGESGEYSHQSHWVAAVCETEAGAESHAQFLRDKWKELCRDYYNHERAAPARHARRDGAYWRDPQVIAWADRQLCLRDEATSLMVLHDPHFDGSPDDFTYEVVKVRWVPA